MPGLTEKELERIRKELETSKRPLFIYDDDADGLCSFLLLYRFLKEGKGVVVKSKPVVDASFARRVEEYDADKVFILDLAVVDEEFVEEARRPIIWIDHHQPLRIEGTQYFNPRVHQADIVYPTSNLCYDVVRQDLWIAMVGCVGDWHLPSFTKEFCRKYPDLLDANVSKPDDALFGSRLGKLVKIVNFLLKGQTKDVKKCISIMAKVESPYDILDQKTEGGKYLYRKFESLHAGYEKLLNEAGKHATEKELIFTYTDDKMSYTSELSNELLHLYPDRLIILARKKGESMRMSLRSSHLHLPSLLDRALSGLRGRGGGHEHACGADVHVDDWDEFLRRVRQ